MRTRPWMAWAGAAGALAAPACAASAPDPRLREVTYDAGVVITVPVKRGAVTVVVLGADESISEVGAGLGSDCTKPDAPWCVAAQAGGRTLFVKPKSTANSANTLAVVTDRRIHNLQFVVLPDGDPRQPVYRLVVRAPLPTPRPPISVSPPGLVPVLPALHALPALPAAPLPPAAEQVVAERLQAKPHVLNTRYSLATGANSEDIVPSLVFDDGRFTYLQFRANREIPAVFHVLEDNSETLINTRMEDDLLIADRVSRRLMLRAGSAVVGLWNDAFDGDGVPPERGTTVPGVRRVIKSSRPSPASPQENIP